MFLQQQQTNKAKNKIVLPEILGYNLSQLLNPKLGKQMKEKYYRTLKNEQAKSIPDCQQLLCAADDPLVHNFQSLPIEVDLFEQNLITKAKSQQNCGSCWAFSTITSLENCILYNTQHNKTNEFWKNEVQNGLDLSEQYLLSNTFGFSNYCLGGDFVMAINYMNQAKQSIELERNYPYNYLHYWGRYFIKMPLNPKINIKDRIIPYQLYPNRLNNQQKTPVVQIFYHPTNKFDQTTIQKIKSYLFNGIPVVAAMHVNYNSLLFSATNMPVTQNCLNEDQNHQVVIVGYKIISINGKSIECWKIKNSWGESFGDNGFFYVPIGNNDFCIEQYAFALIPQNFELINNSQLLKNQIIKGKSSQQQIDETEPYDYKIYLAIYAAFGTSLAFIILGIYLIVERCRHRRTSRRHRAQKKHQVIAITNKLPQ